MSELDDQLERTFVVLFLRKYTHLESLAQLFADGVHLRTEKEIREYCAQNKVLVRPP